MTKQGTSDKQFREEFVKQGNVTWRVYLVALVLGAVEILLEHRIHGISRSLGSAGGALFAIIIVKRRYWRFWWFWIVFGMLASFQIPLAIWTKPLMDSLKFLFMWAFGLVDLFAMSLIVELGANYFDARID